MALDVLIAVLERGEYLSDALESLSDGAEKSGKRRDFSQEQKRIAKVGGKEDRQEKHRQAYIKKVTKGVVERAIELDFRLNVIASKKIKRMHPIVRNILRLGAYELLYMDSIPSSASVNECVKLAKRRGQARASGLVNAVLRKLAVVSEIRENEDAERPILQSPSNLKNKSKLSFQLSICYSMPKWIVQKWVDRFDAEQTEEMLRAFLQEKPLTVRVNQSQISVKEMQEMFARTGIRAERIADVPMALVLYRGDGISVTEMPGFAEGLFYIQDISSMQVCTMAGIRQGESVLDVCAAPGGKALHAADLVGESGTVEARDVSERKVRKIEENVRRCRFSNITTKVWNATELDEECVGKYDVVLADVPCSGLGVLGRKPEIKYRLTEEDVRSLAEIQREILECVQAYVKPNGRLVYSTCTISEKENEEQTAGFLKRHTEFEKVAEKQILPRTDYLGDGFYICVMQRKG